MGSEDFFGIDGEKMVLESFFSIDKKLPGQSFERILNPKKGDVNTAFLNSCIIYGILNVNIKLFYR